MHIEKSVLYIYIYMFIHKNKENLDCKLNDPSCIYFNFNFFLIDLK